MLKAEVITPPAFDTAGTCGAAGEAAGLVGATDEAAAAAAEKFLGTFSANVFGRGVCDAACDRATDANPDVDPDTDGEAAPEVLKGEGALGGCIVALGGCIVVLA